MGLEQHKGKNFHFQVDCAFNKVTYLEYEYAYFPALYYVKCYMSNDQWVRIHSNHETVGLRTHTSESTAPWQKQAHLKFKEDKNKEHRFTMHWNVCAHKGQPKTKCMMGNQKAVTVKILHYTGQLINLYSGHIRLRLPDSFLLLLLIKCILN